MEKLHDLTSVVLTLRRGIEKGRWTLDDLDTAPPGWELNAQEFAKHHPTLSQTVYRNLLREDHHPEKVQAAPDPRDFEANSGSSVQRAGTPLHVPGKQASVVSDVDPVARHDGISGPADSGDQASVGTAGEPPASDGGMPPQW